jgi:hypothetical protein
MSCLPLQREAKPPNRSALAKPVSAKAGSLLITEPPAEAGGNSSESLYLSSSEILPPTFFESHTTLHNYLG